MYTGSLPSRLAHLLQIAGIAGGVVVEADDDLVELQQRLQKVGADEAGDTRYQPAARTLADQPLDFLVAGFHFNDRRRNIAAKARQSRSRYLATETCRR